MAEKNNQERSTEEETSDGETSCGLSGKPQETDRETGPANDREQNHLDNETTTREKAKEEQAKGPRTRTRNRSRCAHKRDEGQIRNSRRWKSRTLRIPWSQRCWR